MMSNSSNRSIFITEFDLQRLLALIQEARHTEYRGSPYLKNLATELQLGKVVSPREVPGDVITMNSRVCLVDMDTGEEMVYTLVFPDDADLSQGKVSILAPVGTAMLGYSVGNTIEWEVPAGIVRLKVKEILYQPEASGDYHL